MIFDSGKSKMNYYIIRSGHFKIEYDHLKYKIDHSKFRYGHSKNILIMYQTPYFK